jgi:hypothetical protein
MAVPSKYVVENLSAALAERAFPTITAWNRLEGRPRRDDFSRALKAEVRDALWMLARQWQIGELHGEDAGSPVSAKMQLRSAPVTKYQAEGGATQAYDGKLPLEAQVEQRPIAWVIDGHKVHLDLRAQVGRQWARLLRGAGLGALEPAYRARYPFAPPAANDPAVVAHRRSWQQAAALAGRAIDGGDLLAELAKGTLASEGIAVVGPGKQTLDTELGPALTRWFARQYLAPAADQAWKPPYLEYQFACSAPQAGREVALVADEYAHGHLDWYAFDRSADRGGLGGAVDSAAESIAVRPFLPAPLTFEGMPDARWWSLEDRKTDFGAVKPSTTDLSQLLLMEFALVYADDWFLLPVRLPAASLSRIEGLVVTNTFGERFWIAASGAGAQDDWHRWAMFQLRARGGGAADPSLFLPPATARTLDGAPLEEIELARDEVANMVWAVERTVPTVEGIGRAGKDEGRETRAFHERRVAAAPSGAAQTSAPIAYLAMTSVPEHWIPFLPVHVAGETREIQLQRGRMLRIIERDPDPPVKVAPRSVLVREGLDRAQQLGYYVHEEEVPRAGATVTRSFRRTRWTGGETYVWIGQRKQTGRGERGSGLAFDAIVDGKKT